LLCIQGQNVSLCYIPGDCKGPDSERAVRKNETFGARPLTCFIPIHFLPFTTIEATHHHHYTLRAVEKLLILQMR
jgi:hypothetical protein